MQKKKYKCILTYDGSEISGWQKQPNASSFQELLEKTLLQITQERASITASGRTDAGVHSLGQVAHFCLKKEIDLQKLLKGLNSLLPKNIRLLSLTEVPDTFHARFSAKRKIYRYFIHTTYKNHPFKQRTSYYFPYPLDTSAMKEATSYFVGRHNFSSFANEANKGSAATSPIKTLYRLEQIPIQDGFYFELEGDGFLYKMVRNIVGTLLDIGRGKIDPKEIPTILEKQDRRLAGAAAPPHGLFLVSVTY